MSVRVDLTTLLADPARAIEVPAQAISAVLAEVCGREAQLAAIRSILAARLATAPQGGSLPSVGPDNMLRIDEATRRLGMSKEWLYKNAARLPFTRRQGRRALRFSAAGIERYLARRGA